MIAFTKRKHPLKTNFIINNFSTSLGALTFKKTSTRKHISLSTIFSYKRIQMIIIMIMIKRHSFRTVEEQGIMVSAGYQDILKTGYRNTPRFGNDQLFNTKFSINRNVGYKIKVFFSLAIPLHCVIMKLVSSVSKKLVSK